MGVSKMTAASLKTLEMSAADSFSAWGSLLMSSLGGRRRGGLGGKSWPEISLGRGP